MFCAQLNENYKPLTCRNNRADRSVNIELLNCGLNSLKLSMRRCEKKKRTQREKKKYCNNYHIFLEEPFVSEIRESIIGHADMRNYILNVSPGISLLSHLASSLK